MNQRVLLLDDDANVNDSTLVEVALPVPLFQTFTYALSGKYTNVAQVGSRVIVPFRQRKMVGVVVGVGVAKPKKSSVKPVQEIPDAEPALSIPMLELCRWIAEYYVVPFGMVVRSVLPVLLTGAAAPNPTRKTQRVLRILEELPSLLQRDKTFARAPQQRAVYELVETLGGVTTIEHLRERLDVSASVIKSLAKRGLIAIESEEVDRDPFRKRGKRPEHHHVPTTAQATAISQMEQATAGEVFLLRGITGSGKTLVYIELLRTIVHERNQSAIVLVPEIALTPQTVDRFRSVFGDTVAVLHSAISDGERYDAWLALKRGDKKIAVGARSAIFAPVANLGAIIVDEEHESSYKQGENPRYHARETAIVRAKQEGAIVVLGSATPSLESWVNATSGKYSLLTLPDRAGGASLPSVDVIDLRQSLRSSREATYSDYRRVINDPLDAALESCLAKKEQSILLLNRRGYSAFVQCDTCGNVAACPNCSITLTYHRSPERLVCHYCMHHEVPQKNCERCGGVTLHQRGMGTQQVERLLSERFPSARIARMDIDTTTGKWAHADILDRVGNGEVDILLGTQMIAKGLDFPNVTLVGVVDADVGINLPDFRASERCFQLLSQVAGRAGRGPKGGRVMIQTREPTHHAVKYAVTHDYLSFVTEELAGRESPVYPPNNRVATIVFSGLNEVATSELAEDGTRWLRRLLKASKAQGITTIGPSPCPVERIKTRWRWHTLIKAEHPQELTRVARYFMERFTPPKNAFQLRITFDRDPVSLL